MAYKSLKFKSTNRPLVGPTEMQGSCDSRCKY